MLHTHNAGNNEFEWWVGNRGLAVVGCLGQTDRAHSRAEGHCRAGGYSPAWMARKLYSSCNSSSNAAFCLAWQN